MQQIVFLGFPIMRKREREKRKVEMQIIKKERGSEIYFGDWHKNF